MGVYRVQIWENGLGTCKEGALDGAELGDVSHGDVESVCRDGARAD